MLGLQPQAPVEQLLGKSPPPAQHRPLVILPPEATQLLATPPPPPVPALPALPPLPAEPPAPPVPEPTQSLPSQQVLAGHWQTLTVCVDPGPQPQAPTRQVFGKSGVEVQHSASDTVPPACSHALVEPPLPAEPELPAWPAEPELPELPPDPLVPALPPVAPPSVPPRS